MVICFPVGVNLIWNSCPYAILMPGQLSERSGMALPLAGDEVFERLAGGFDALTGGRFRYWVTQAPAEELGGRFVAPTAMVLYGALCAEVALSRFGPPEAVAGYSLGFYAAGLFARCVKASAVLEWLDRVNAANGRDFPPGRFALASETGLSRAEIEALFDRWGLAEVTVANINNPKQVVFAGPRGAVQRAIERLKGLVMEVRLLPLDVPLHTPYVERARSEATPWWQGVPASDPLWPIISPRDGRVIIAGREFRKEVAEALSAPTDWVAAVTRLRELGLRRLLDLSPGGELGRMARWTVRDLEILPVSSLWESGA
jgi:[acyl-carrier-protein] S-malonyltransferase